MVVNIPSATLGHIPGSGVTVKSSCTGISPSFSSACPSGHTLPALLLCGGSPTELRRNRLPFFPGNFLGQLGFCKGLRLLLPLWGLISPVYTVEMLVQMVAKKTCLPDPMTWSLWNAERCRGATQVCPSWDKRTQGPPREVGTFLTQNSGGVWTV